MILPMFLLSLVALAPTNAREIQVDLQAPWAVRTVHPIIEVAEFLADQSSADFWTFVDDMCASQSSMKTVDAAMTFNTEESLHTITNLAHTVGIQLVPTNVQNILEFSSSLGMFLPAVEFYESLSSSVEAPCGAGNSYVLSYPGGVISCSRDVAKSPSFDFTAPTNMTDQTANMPWNHEFPFGAEKKVSAYEHSAVRVLYGVIGSSSFCEQHADLSAAAAAGSSRYVARHSFPGLAVLSPRRPAQGFGVFLDIKNMEYRNADDSKEKDAAVEEAAQVNAEDGQAAAAVAAAVVFDAEEEVEGVVFSTLLDRYPHLSRELEMAREELLAQAEASGDGSAEMKMWKVLDLGLQTTQSIMAAPDKVSAMNNILHNFPKHASSLSSVRVDEGLKETAMHYYRSGAMQGIPINSLFVNGLRVDLSAATLNIFDIISNIRQELKNSDYLTKKGVSSAVRKELLRHAAGLASGGVSTATTRDEQMMEFVKSIKRVDVSKGGKYSIHFLNNLEKDPQYKRLPKSVMTLLQPSWQLTGLSRNIYTLVAVVNPVSIEGASMIFQINQIHEQQYPVRVGVVWACDAVLAPGEALVDAASAEDVCRLFGEAKETHGLKAAMAVVSRIAGIIEEEAENKFEPSLMATEGAIATAAAQTPIFVTKEQAIESYADAISTFKKAWTSKSAYHDEAASILSEKKGTDFVANATTYLSQRGLPTNSFSLNGIVQESDDIMSYLMQLLGREQQLLSVLVSLRKVTDNSKSIFASILSASPSYSRYHSLIEEVTPEYIDTSTQDYINMESSAGSVWDSRVLSQQVCGAVVSQQDEDISSDSVLFNSTLVAVPVHTDFGLRSLLSAVTWFLETVTGHPDDDSMTCRAPMDHSEGGHRLRVVLLAPKGSAPVPHLQRLAALSAMLQAREPLSVYVMKSTLELLLGGSSLQDALEQLLGSFTRDERLKEVSVLQEVLQTLAAMGADPSKIVEVLEGKLALSASTLQASAYASRAMKSPDVEDVVLHFNSRRLVVSAAKGSPLHALDLAMLVDIEYPRLGDPLSKTMALHPGKIVGGSAPVPFSGADFLFMASYCGRYAASGGSRADVMGVMEQAGFSVAGSHEGRVPSDHFVFNVEGEGHSQEVSLVFVVHPLTMAGQRTAALVKLIQEHLQLTQTVILVPQMDLTVFPLQNFFRFIAPSVSATGVSASSGVFKKLPRQHTLTVRIDTPEAWNVQTFAAEQDIDNLKCSKYKCGDASTAAAEISRVSYQLKNIALAGQCYEGWASGRPNPPNGLQIVLNRAPAPLTLIRSSASTDSSKSGNDADTLVMKNLGYYQLQANPGLWQLGLAKGRAASLYTLDDAQRRGQESMWVPVLSFASAMHQLLVTKRPGMGALSLLDDEGGSAQQAEKGMWDKLSAQVQGLWGKGSETAVVSGGEQEDNRIHVFSLATGQVYERLLRIMMLSAVKRTSVPIKFWLFEYYLSPAFKATVEAMAAEYHFEVGYVVYKWPEWLHQQTEKQRVIWGYKILFLDVLFPLNVKKVIYVDADQVVRADLKELWDMDLEGKPYAYTPFCDSREETLGFQFWRQGYWADHLRGKPYHISALYVVDLQVFRQKAVGDSLRAVYDQLSKDPNSLSNLDQDLPNYAQHIVPIHSLPQEWLWCESWCSDKTKKQAKTIDLCNNPLYKEPKLDMAKRVINGSLFPESWVELDEEIKTTILKTGMTVEY